MRLIDADELKDEMSKVFFNDNDDMKRLEELIDNAPTVVYPFYQEAYQTGYEEGKNERPLYTITSNTFVEGASARPQGKWNYIQTGMAVCPFCGATPHKQYKNYCPNCGADMRGDKK